MLHVAKSYKLISITKIDDAITALVNFKNAIMLFKLLYRKNVNDDITIREMERLKLDIIICKTKSIDEYLLFIKHILTQALDLVESII